MSITIVLQMYAYYAFGVCKYRPITFQCLSRRTHAHSHSHSWVYLRPVKLPTVLNLSTIYSFWSSLV